jgi:hypothetical protein
MKRVSKTRILGIMLLMCVAPIILLMSCGESINVDAEWNTVLAHSIEDDMGYCVQQTSDLGYIVVGCNSSVIGSTDVWLIKLDENGRKKWDKSFHNSKGDEGYCVRQTSDDGYIIVGQTAQLDSYSSNVIREGDLWLIKTDSDGDEVWNKVLGGEDADTGHCVQQTTDGGYVILGGTASYGHGRGDFWLIKTDSNGNEVWSKTFGGSAMEEGKYVQQTSDGGYIMVGRTYSFGAGLTDIWLIKADSNGNEVWNKTFGGVDYDDGNCVQETSDGCYVLLGYTRSFGASVRDMDDMWLIKTDSDGNWVWSKRFGGLGGQSGNCVQETTDGGYILLGHNNSYTTNGCDVWLIKMDSDGNEVWDKTFGGPLLDSGYYVQETSDGGYIITGYFGSSPPFWARLIGYDVNINLWTIKVAGGK